MISFTDHTAPAPSRHLEDFGGFGIQVEPQWAASKGANRVTYLEERGPLFEAMRELFSIGYAQATRAIRHPDDGMWRMAYVYKPAAAAFGAPLWAHLLTIYEYLEPAEHAYQSEWRVVHPTGVGNLSRDTTERIQNVSPPQGWAKFLHVLPINPADVIGFVCPNQACAELAARLPDAFRNKPVVAYDG